MPVRIELDARRRRLRAALAAVLVKAHASELRLMHDWLDSWAGIGLVVVGMTHQGFQRQSLRPSAVSPATTPHVPRLRR